MRRNRIECRPDGDTINGWEAIVERSAWEQRGILMGVVAVVLTVAGFALAGSSPDFLAEPQEIADYYADDNSKVTAAAWVGMIGTAALIWFLGELWARLRSAEGGNGRLSGIAFGGGLVAAAMFLLVDMVNLAGAIRADEDGKIDPGVAATLYDVSGLSIAAAAFALSVLAFATAAVAFRTGVLPRWLAWLSLPFGVALLTPINWIVVLVGLLWVLAVSISLYVRPRRPAGAPPTAPDAG